jgi:hypothetical protein
MPFACAMLAAAACDELPDGPVCSGVVPGEYLVAFEWNVDAHVAATLLVTRCGGELLDVWTSALNGFWFRCDPHFELKTSAGPWPSPYCFDVLACMSASPAIDYIEPNQWACQEKCPCVGPQN